MGRHIIKLRDDKTRKVYYLEWSSIVDAPVTYGLSLKEFKKYYKDEYGRNGMKQLPELLKRVDTYGLSERTAVTLEYYFKNNRAGKNETCLDKEGLLNKFCRQRGKYK